MKAVAIITARGGSKRIPKKNIKDFLGKPIIAYSIEAALQSGCFEDVIVSTDSEEIADISKKYLNVMMHSMKVFRKMYLLYVLLRLMSVKNMRMTSSKRLPSTSMRCS